MQVETPPHVVNGVGQLDHMHRPALHVPLSQMRPQAPQLTRSLIVSVHAPSQTIPPPGHPHVPPAHDAPVGQTVSQEPQWFASEERSKHSKRPTAHAVSPVGHRHTPAEQEPLPQTVPQSPQLLGSVA